MAGQRRIDLPDVTQHFIQLGNDRPPRFFRDIDGIRYLQNLHELSPVGTYDVHVNVLVTNHAHLPITLDQTGVISRLPHSLGRRYVRYINETYGEPAHCAKGRHKSHLVVNDEHLPRCYPYIKPNPIRVWMVAHAGDYRWSSYGCDGAR